MERQLLNILPIKGVEHDCIVSKMGDITVAFEAILPEIFTLSNEEYEAFHQSWVKAIKVLPKHTVFHKQDWFTENQYRQDSTDNESSFLSSAS